MGLSGVPVTTLRGLDALRQVPADKVVPTLDEARETALRLLEG